MALGIAAVLAGAVVKNEITTPNVTPLRKTAWKTAVALLSAPGFQRRHRRSRGVDRVGRRASGLSR